MKSRNLSRRDAVKATLAVGTGSLFTTSAATAGISTAPVTLKKGATILFQGDSITDAGRNKGDNGANSGGALGRGYPFLLSGYLLMKYPEFGLKIYNRGISGNKVPDLDNRWQKDCLDLKPDVLSILIGVNDIWHKLNGRYDGTVEVYEKGFTALIERTRTALPETQLVVCDPFVLRCGSVNDSWFPEFDERRAAARRVAEASGAVWVPFQETFDTATTGDVKPQYWSGDGVHPSLAGHTLMSAAWIKATGLK